MANILLDGPPFGEPPSQDCWQKASDAFLEAGGSSPNPLQNIREGLWWKP
jgi:hypothetical protein